jgi:hypothetical protein
MITESVAQTQISPNGQRTFSHLRVRGLRLRLQVILILFVCECAYNYNILKYQCVHETGRYSKVAANVISFDNLPFDLQGSGERKAVWPLEGQAIFDFLCGNCRYVGQVPIIY